MSLRIFRLFFPGWRASTWKCAPAQHLWSPVSFSLQQSGTSDPKSDPLFRPTRDVFFNERKNHRYLLFPNKKNFYVRPKITLNSHLTQNYIGYTTCGLICARAQCSFDRDKARQTSRELPAIYSTEQSSSFSSWSWLFKKPFHVQFKPSRVSKTTMHCVYNDALSDRWSRHVKVPSHTHREKEISGEKV